MCFEIYKYINPKKPSEVYVGGTFFGLKRRHTEHRMRSKSSQSRFYKAFRTGRLVMKSVIKYPDMFDTNDQAVLDRAADLERHWIRELKSHRSMGGLNHNWGGAGFKNRTGVHPATKKKMIRMYVDENASLLKVSKEVGWSRDTVMKILMAEGVEIRSHAAAAAHRWEDPEEHAKARITQKECTNRPEVKEKTSKSLKKYWTPQARLDHSVRLRKAHAEKPEMAQEMAERSRESQSRPDVRLANTESSTACFVMVNGVPYPSAHSAGKVLGSCGQTVNRRLDKGAVGYQRITREVYDQAVAAMSDGEREEWMESFLFKRRKGNMAKSRMESIVLGAGPKKRSVSTRVGLPVMADHRPYPSIHMAAFALGHSNTSSVRKRIKRGDDGYRVMSNEEIVEVWKGMSEEERAEWNDMVGKKVEKNGVGNGFRKPVRFGGIDFEGINAMGRHFQVSRQTARKWVAKGLTEPPATYWEMMKRRGEVVHFDGQDFPNYAAAGRHCGKDGNVVKGWIERGFTKPPTREELRQEYESRNPDWREQMSQKTTDYFKRNPKAREAARQAKIDYNKRNPNAVAEHAVKVGKPVMVEGRRFHTAKEAGEFLGMTGRGVSLRISRGYPGYHHLVKEPGVPLDKLKVLDDGRAPHYSHCGTKQVLVDGKPFISSREAAKAVGITLGCMYARIAKGYAGYRYITMDEYTEMVS